MKKNYFLITFVTLIALGLGFSIASAAPLGAFELKTADGGTFTNEDIKGTSAIFLLVQTACGQCKSELDEIGKNFDKLSELAPIYAILVDAASDRAVEIYNKRGYRPIPLLDPKFSFGLMADVTSTPATIIVNDKGEVVWTKRGFRNGQTSMFADKLK